MKKNTKIAIHHNIEAYTKHLMDWNKKQSLQKEINQEMTSLINKEIEINDFENVIETFYSIVEQEKKEVNTMGLNGQKLCSLFDINISKLLSLTSQLNFLNIVTEPTIENYTTYAETDEQIERYNFAIEVVNIIKKSKEYISQPYGYYSHILNGFNPILTFNHEINDFEPNIHFILNN